MPFNGSGTYTLSDTIAPATSADANELQAILTDIQNALTNCVCQDGQATITAALKGFAGTVSVPGYGFSADSNTGMYRVAADNLGLTCGGTEILDLTTTGASVTGTFAASGNVAINTNKFNITAASGNTLIAGTLGLTGAMIASSSISCLSDLGVAGFLTLSSTDAMLMAKGTTGNRSTTTEGVVRYNTTLHGIEFRNASAWVTLGQSPTVQSFTSGSGTYTAPTGCLRVRVRMVGPGGGGAGSTANNGNASANNTSFESWTAIKGSGGTTSTGAGGAGGTGGADGTGTKIIRLDGAKGGGGTSTSSGSYPTGNGGASVFGGAGAAAAGSAGTTAAANTGSGGAGGTVSNGNGGGGGGAGEYVEFMMTAAQASGASYTVGAGGTNGAAGGQAGGSGAAGLIIVEEFYS